MRHLICCLFLACLIAPALHAEELTEFRSRAYEVHTDLPLAEAKGLASYMDDVFAEYSRRLADFQVRRAERVRLYLFRDQNGYLEHLAEIGIVGTNSGGMFYVVDGEAGLATFVRGQRRRRMLHVLQHEGFHQFAFERIGPRLPIWTNEGLAEYFGSAVPVRGRLRLGQFDEASLESLRRAIRGGSTFPFDEMLSMTNEQWALRVATGDARAGLMYTQSWSMVHFLLHGARGRFLPMFEDYLHNIKRGLEPMHAFTKAFGTDDIASFETAWKKFVLDELEPDPLSTAADRLEFLGAGLEMLHEQGVRPATIEDLKRELHRRGFGLRIWSEGITRELSSSQDELFEAPSNGKRRRGSRIDIVPPRSERLPPGVVVRGLDATVQLVWRYDETGGLVADIEFR